MKPNSFKFIVAFGLPLQFLGLLGTAPAQTPSAAPAPVAMILEMRGEGVQVSRQAGVWDPARTNQALFDGNLVQTDERSQVLLRFSSLETVHVPERSTLRIHGQTGKKHGLELLKGLLYFFHRDKPNQFEVPLAPQRSAIIRGTEFVLEAVGGITTLSLVDGEVTVRDTSGEELDVKSGEQVIAEPGKPLRKTAILEPKNIIQWFLYYPAVLNLDELGLDPAERTGFENSLTAYRRGDLVAAFTAYPKDRQPLSDKERIYLAALRLSFGEVREAQKVLDTIQPDSPLLLLASSLSKLIGAVQGVQSSELKVQSPKLTPQLSTLLLAESYWQQSLNRLPEALAAARQSVEVSPLFSFAWARVAELEFSFGHTRAASEAIDRSLQLGPRNAQAQALRGFLLAAQNHISQAISAFNESIAIDPALANPWLGRGLCRIKQGHAEEGRQDLQVAATMEPNRAVLRSYLGKAFSNAGADALAAKELNLAKQIDPHDPTAWLYAALFYQQQNQINQAIRDLEHSEALNDNRRTYRSQLRLDEDRAVRSANLASIYRDAGMRDVSVREAARAVAYDYANDSAHLFLADSYNELRDPTRFNLRYETVWFNELLLANLLSPVGGGRLSQHVSQQEYSRLFEADRLGFANSTVARSDKSFTELASQFGTFGGTSYAFDLEYRNNKGVRPNNDLDSIEWYTTIKQQVTPQDSVLALVKYEDYDSGDNFQYYDPTNARPHFRFEEHQHPIVVAGWHHEWSPDAHTLLLAGRLENEQHFKDLSAPQLLFTELSNGQIDTQVPGAFDVDYHNKLEIYTAELNQIFKWKRLTLSAGGRGQFGQFHAQSLMQNPSGPPLLLFNGTPTNTTSSEDFERFTGYGYLTLEPVDRLYLIGGVAYDTITYPSNFRNPPLSSGQDHRNQLGPKAGLVWNPVPVAAVRGVFTRSLGGVSLDESYRLEPTQLAGFPQAFRTLISESVVGSVAAPKYETFGLALDLKFPSGTYGGIQAERLNSNVRRTIGLYSLDNGIPPFVTGVTSEQLDYREDLVALSLNQLVGDTLSLGASYKFAKVRLDDTLPAVPTGALLAANMNQRATLHNASAYVLFNHPSGFFARAESHWYHQSNSGYQPAIPGDDFFQHNLFAGYSFAHRRVELLLGILNLTGQDYHLNPLTVYSELPRERTFMARFRFLF